LADLALVAHVRRSNMMKRGDIFNGHQGVQDMRDR
jgi:hypothetical protein